MARKIEFKQRQYDGRWMMVGYVPDPNYNMADFEGREILFPMRQVVLKVYDLLIDLYT